MPHVTYDYTVPRALSAAVQTVPPSIKMPLYLHLPEPSQNYQDAVSSISQDFNASWVSVTEMTGDTEEERGGMSFNSRNLFPSNSTPQGKEWGWKHGPQEDNLNFQFHQLYHTSETSEDEEVTAEKEADLGQYPFIAYLVNHLQYNTRLMGIGW